VPKFACVEFLNYLCRRSRGAPSGAEIIPCEPDADNADEGSFPWN